MRAAPLTVPGAVLVALALTIASSSAAQPADRERAKKHFDVAELHFKAGEHAEALDQYTKAHALSKEPALLWNMGLCNEKLGNVAEASRQYAAYLEALPDGEKAEEARYRTGVLDKILAEKANADKLKSQQPPARSALTLRLAVDDKPYAMTLTTTGGVTLECPKTTFVAPCVLPEVPAGPVRLEVRRDGDSATTTFESAGGVATRRVRFTAKKQGYKNYLLAGGIGALALGGLGMVLGFTATPEGENGPNLGFLLPGIGLVFGGAVLTTFGAVGMGGTTVDPSVSVR